MCAIIVKHEGYNLKIMQEKSWFSDQRIIEASFIFLALLKLKAKVTESIYISESTYLPFRVPCW